MNNNYSDPFLLIEEHLCSSPLVEFVDAIIIDFHCEASSEKVAMGLWCDGRVSAVFGTHTHIPTADGRILPGGTAFQSDVGMCGNYDSVTGMDKEVILKRFVDGFSFDRMRDAQGEGTVSGAFLVTDDSTGLASSVHPVRIGGVLENIFPPQWGQF